MIVEGVGTLGRINGTILHFVAQCMVSPCVIPFISTSLSDLHLHTVSGDGWMGIVSNARCETGRESC